MDDKPWWLVPVAIALLVLAILFVAPLVRANEPVNPLWHFLWVGFVAVGILMLILRVWDSRNK